MGVFAEIFLTREKELDSCDEFHVTELVKIDKEAVIMALCNRLQSGRTSVCVCPCPGLQEPMAGGSHTHAPQGAGMTLIRPN